MGDPQNPIDQLITKFKRAADFEVTFVRGVVEQVNTLVEAGKIIYILHIANGKRQDSFWLAHNHADPYFYPPRAGDQVKGVVNTLDDCEIFAGVIHKPIFDFENLSNDSERTAFAWLAQNGERFAKEAETRRLAKRDISSLYRKLGLDRT